MASFTEFQVDGEANAHMICFYSTLNYRLGDGSTLPIEQETAWCGQCRSFISAEYLSSVEELHVRIRELQFPNEKHYFLFGSESGIKDAIDELRHRVSWRQTRQSPAHCLACGSTEIVPIRFGEDGSCIVNGKQLIETVQGFAETEDWIAEFSSEGLAHSERPAEPAVVVDGSQRACRSNPAKRGSA